MKKLSVKEVSDCCGYPTYEDEGARCSWCKKTCEVKPLDSVKEVVSSCCGAKVIVLINGARDGFERFNACNKCGKPHPLPSKTRDSGTGITKEMIDNAAKYSNQKQAELADKADSGKDLNIFEWIDACMLFNKPMAEETKKRIRTLLQESREAVACEIVHLLDDLEHRQPEDLKTDNWRNWKYIRNSIVDKYDVLEKLRNEPKESL